MPMPKAKMTFGADASASWSAVLFDLDGTLADTLGDVVLAINGALARKGLPPAGRAIVRANLGVGGMALTKAAIASTHSEPPAGLVAEVHALYLGMYEDCLVTHTRLYPGAADMLARLQASGVAVALCTNKATSLTIPLLRTLGVDDAFDEIVCGDSLERKKPAPDQLWHLLSRLKIGSASAVMVGDTAIDMEAAEAAFVTFVHARYGYGELLPQARLWIESLGEFANAVLCPVPGRLHP